MADVKDTVAIETGLEPGAHPMKYYKDVAMAEVQKAKRAGKKMFENKDGHLIDQKSSYQPKNRKASAARKKSLSHGITVHHRYPEAQDSFAFDPQYPSIPCPSSSHNTNQTTY